MDRETMMLEERASHDWLLKLRKLEQRRVEKARKLPHSAQRCFELGEALANRRCTNEAIRWSRRELQRLDKMEA